MFTIFGVMALVAVLVGIKLVDGLATTMWLALDFAGLLLVAFVLLEEHRRKATARHLKRHHRKYLIGLALVAGLYGFGTVGYHASDHLQPIKIGPTAAKPAADPFGEKGVNDISPAGIDQTGDSDCFFESAEAATANSAQGREIIFHQIKTNRDGSYTVTFKGDPSDPVQVTQAELAETYRLGEVQDSQLWGRIVETGFMEYDHIMQFGKGPYSYQKSGIPYLSKVPLGDTSAALELITGQPVAVDGFGAINGEDPWTLHIGRTSAANVSLALVSAFDAGEPVTALADNKEYAQLGFQNPGPIDEDHVYSVLKFIRQSNIVFVRNPWGSNSAPFDVVARYLGDPSYKPVDGITSLPDGILAMPLATFMHLYDSMYMAGTSPTANDLANISHDIASGNVKFLFLDSLFTTSDLTDRGVTNVAVGAWHGIERLAALIP